MASDEVSENEWLAVGLLFFVIFAAVFAVHQTLESVLP